VDVKNLEALGGHVASRLEPLVDARGSDDALRAKLAEHAASRKAPASWTKPRVLVPVFGFAAVAIAAAFLVVPRGGPPPLAFTVGTPERPGVLGETVTAPGSSGTSLRFSEGSRIALDPKARAKVARSTPKGADLVLEAGRAQLDIVPRAESAWRVQTGPFVVIVTGTRFDLDWNPATDHFSLALYEGKVTVSGCTFGEGKKLVAGERAEASCKAGKQSIAPLTTAAKDGARTVQRSEPAVGAEREPAHTANAEKPSEASHASATKDHDWPSLARSGRYGEAYALASSAGIVEECGRRGADDVLLLGESARLTGHAEDARLAYQAVRRRFGKSPEAAQAAFNLGRLEVRGGQKGAAAGWFETYLREQPSGPLAQAALGRLLEARVELGDTRAARDTARSYLERYPAGPHAEAARKVLESETRR
jgi:TolA-binding protein